MNTAINALIVLAFILGFGWLIFGLGGKPGDIALGFLLGVVACVFYGVYIVKAREGGGHG